MGYNVIQQNKSPVFHSMKQPLKYNEIQLPNEEHNYCLVDNRKVDYYVNQREYAIPKLEKILNNANDEKEIIESLYIVDQLIDNKVQGADKMYPTISRFNDSESPNVQTFLAGIYRKTHPPDAFGPLMSMLIKNTMSPPQTPKYFDPNEEIGGAILSYLA